MDLGNKTLTGKLLLDLARRPTPEEVVKLSEQNIYGHAKRIRYLICPEDMEKICLMHQNLMPVVENAIRFLIKENDWERPDYYFFARDCELLYDAMWGIGQAGERDLTKRINLVKLSMFMCDSQSEENKEYFKEIGITQERFKKGPKMVFVDSGFIGSMFSYVRRIVAPETKLPNENMKGYLVSRSERSKFTQIELNKKIRKEYFRKVRKKIDNSVYARYTGNKIKDLNLILCGFMQLMPKFTGRYIEAYQGEDGKWDVLPEANNFSLILKEKVLSNGSRLDDEQINSLQAEICNINASIVNPPASLILQKRTLDYFLNPNVWDRIYYRIKK